MTDISMTKSELIERIVAAQARSSSAQLNSKDVEFAVKTMLEQMSQTLASGDRIEIRGFGSFSLHLGDGLRNLCRRYLAQECERSEG